MYISIAAGVPLPLLNKYTISRTQVLFYTHGTCIPSLPLAESEEILRQLHPEPDEIAVNLERIMSLLVYLKEEQDGIVRELRRVGSRCGIDDINVGGSSNNAPLDGEDDLGEGWRSRMDKLEGEMERLRGLLGDVVKGGLPAGKALERGATLGEAVGEDDQANPAKRKRIEKSAVESNKRVAKPPSPTFIQPRGDKPSTKPAAVPSVIAKPVAAPLVMAKPVVIPPVTKVVMAKPVIVPPAMKAKGKKGVVEIEESEEDEYEENSDSEEEEEVSDSDEDKEDKEEEYRDDDEEEGESEESEEEEARPVNTKQKTTGSALAGAQWKVRGVAQGRNDKEREKDKEREREKEKEREREEEIEREREEAKARQQEKEKARASRTGTSLPLANGGRVGLGTRRKTAGGR